MKIQILTNIPNTGKMQQTRGTFETYDEDGNQKSFTVSENFIGKLPQKLKRFEIESVKQKLYEKFKIYGVTNRCDFKTSRRWHVGQRDLSSTRHQPADIF